MIPILYYPQNISIAIEYENLQQTYWKLYNFINYMRSFYYASCFDLLSIIRLFYMFVSKLLFSYIDQCLQACFCTRDTSYCVNCKLTWAEFVSFTVNFHVSSIELFV
jgi:hypothetical protein